MTNLEIEHYDALVIGAGPAGLMASEELGREGLSVLIVDAMPSPARKFLMAGKSGLNLTKDESQADFLNHFSPLPKALKKALDAFAPNEISAWSEELGQPVFTGSTGRVFPKTMKASPLLRAWLKRLETYQVGLRRRWRWIGFDDVEADERHHVLKFQTSEGVSTVQSTVVVLAMGGASWARLGSDGKWVGVLPEVDLAEFQAANAALDVPWTKFMTKQFGQAVKNIALSCGPYKSQGEIVISKTGLEGGGIYSVSRGVREGHSLTIDLLPGLSLTEINARLAQRKAKDSIGNVLRKRLRLTPEKIALLNEFEHPLPVNLAPVLKRLVVKSASLRPMDEAISTAGGVRFEALSETLELKARKNIFACGEMLDWEAPTGGYLLTACLATGRAAGRAASAAVQASRDE